MADQAINIRITLKDEVTKNLAKVNDSLRDMGLKMRQVGREMSYVGMNITAVGASITAPLIVAYKQAGKFNADIAHQLSQTQNTFDNLSVSIGKSLLPVMKQLTDSVANAVGWWNSLDEATRGRIIQNIWNLGKNLLILGTSLVVVGKAISTLGNLALLMANFGKLAPIFAALTGPIGWVTLAFVGLTLAMIKWKGVADTVLITLQAFPRAVAIMMGMPKEDINRILGTGTEWAKGFDDLKKQFSDFADTYKEIMGSLTKKGAGVEGNQGFLAGFSMACENAGT